MIRFIFTIQFIVDDISAFYPVYKGSECGTTLSRIGTQLAGPKLTADRMGLGAG